MIDKQGRCHETQQQLDPIRAAHCQRMARRQRGQTKACMDNGRGQQQRLAEARLPWHQQRPPPPFHRVDRHQAESEVAQVAGDEEKQEDAASEPDAPYDQTREHCSFNCAELGPRSNNRLMKQAVVPAQAGTQGRKFSRVRWAPASAGATISC